MTRLICLSLLTMALHLQAATTTVWEGTKVFSSWSDVLNIAGSEFSQVQADDVVLFSITARDGAQLQVSYGTGWTNFDGLSALSVAGDYHMVVSPAMVGQLRQGIPIIWRPLHEGSGRWFWWGSDGAEAYKQLYRYMFHHFQQRGIHNLLWVWTSEIGDDDWYPGDEYVDIVARDGYPQNNTTHLSQAADFRKLCQAHSNKMTALPECNSVPSWENMQRDEALWLIVAPWCGGTAFDNGNTADFWRQFLNEEGIVTR